MKRRGGKTSAFVEAVEEVGVRFCAAGGRVEVRIHEDYAGGMSARVAKLESALKGNEKREKFVAALEALMDEEENVVEEDELPPVPNASRRGRSAAGKRANERNVEAAPILSLRHLLEPMVLQRKNANGKARMENDENDARDANANLAAPAGATATTTIVAPSTAGTRDAVHGINRTACTSSNSMSLVRFLLSVPSVQAGVARLLVARLPSCADESEARLILQQFRWLTVQREGGRDMTEAFIEVLPAMPMELRAELIMFLPEIVSDAEHEAVVSALDDIICENTELLLPVLDALGNLTLTDSLRARVIGMALNFLAAARLEHLPIVVRFVLQNATEENVKDVVIGLRALDFAAPARNNPAAGAGTSRDARGKRKLDEHSTEEALILESLQTGLGVRSLVCDAVLDEIRAESDPNRHKAIDFLMLMIIHGISGTRERDVEMLLRKKLRTGQCTPAFLTTALGGRGETLHFLFEGILKVASSLVQWTDASVRQGGSRMYRASFVAFVDSFHRQEILGAILTHVSSGSPFEMSAALDDLLHLAKHQNQVLLQYASFLSSLLDFLDRFSVHQLRVLFEIFSELATSPNSSAGSRLEDELNIVIQKQISSSFPSYRRVGIIGTVTLLKKLGSAQDDGRPCERRLETCLQMLRPRLQELERHPRALALLYDELAAAVSTGELLMPLLEFLRDSVFENFETTFFADIEDAMKLARDSRENAGVHGLSSHAPLGHELWLNLDDDQAPVALSLMSLLERNDEKSREQAQCMFSQFRLLVAVERKYSGSLESIDALLGCPLLLFDRRLLQQERFRDLDEGSKQLICTILFFAINWFRELINCFGIENMCADRAASGRGATSDSDVPPPAAPSDDIDDEATRLRQKLLSRCCHICWMEEALVRCLSVSERVYLPNLRDLFGDPILATSAATSNASKLKKRKQAHAGKTGSTASGSSKRAKKRKTKATGAHADDADQDGDEYTENGCVDDDDDAETTTTARELEDVRVTAAPPATTPASSTQKWASAPVVRPGGKIPSFRKYCREFNIAAFSVLTVQGSMFAPTEPELILPILTYVLSDFFVTVHSAFADGRSMSCFEKTYHASSYTSLDPADVAAAAINLLGSVRTHLETAVEVITSPVRRRHSRSTDDADDACVRNVVAIGVSTEADASAFPLECIRGSGDAEAGALLVLEYCIAFARVLLDAKTLKSYDDVAEALLQCFGQTMMTTKGARALWRNEDSGALLTPKLKEDYTKAPEMNEVSAAEDDGWRSVFRFWDKTLRRLQRSRVVDTRYEIEIVNVLHAVLLLESRASVEHDADILARRAGSILQSRFRDTRKAAKASAPRRRRDGDSDNGAEDVHDGYDDDTRSGDAESWQGRNAVIVTLLKHYFTGTQKLEFIASLAVNELPKVPSRGILTAPSDFGSLSSWSFAAYFRMTFVALNQEMASLAKAVDTKSKDIRDMDEILPAMQTCASALSALMGLCKVHESKTMLLAQAIRLSTRFLDSVVRSCPHLQSELEKDTRVPDLLKSIQKSTRPLQSLCSEGKVRMEPKIAMLVPAARRTMERFILIVKNMFQDTSRHLAVRNLKHKNLHGQTVPSQVVADVDDDDDDEEETEEDDHVDDDDSDRRNHARGGLNGRSRDSDSMRIFSNLETIEHVAGNPRACPESPSSVVLLYEGERDDSATANEYDDDEETEILAQDEDDDDDQFDDDDNDEEI